MDELKTGCGERDPQRVKNNREARERESIKTDNQHKE